MLIIERKDGSIYVRASSMLTKFSAKESQFTHKYRFNDNAPTIKRAESEEFEMYNTNPSKVEEGENHPEIGEDLMFVNMRRAAS